MKLLISGVSTKDNQTIAYIRFEEADCWAEGIIPECRITKQNGFSEEQVSQLEDYLKANLTELKKEAAKVNPFNAMFRK